MAGSSVSATETATVTEKAAPRPITVSTGIFATDRPARAMITVVPANTTALPAVARARLMDSTTSRPSASWPRWRDRMKSA